MPPLQQHVLFASQDIDEARRQVGRVFCPHELTPAKRVRALDARMHHARVTSNSSLNYLTYGTEVRVEPGPLGDFFNVQVQLSGSVATRCGSRFQTARPGEAIILSPDEFVSMDWTRNAAMLIFSISREVVERKLMALLDSHLPEPLVFESKIRLSEPAGAGWIRAVRFLADELDGGPGFLNYSQAVSNFEESLVISLLHGQQHNYSGALRNGIRSIAPAHVKRVESYIRENAQQPITIEDLARISRTSVRSLFSGFRRFRGNSPMKFLREIRLQNVREELKTCSRQTSVTEVAGRWGFVQLGRFAAAYREQFGELPSETLRRSR